MSRLKPAPDFTSSADLIAHYSAVRARLANPKPVLKLVPLAPLDHADEVEPSERFEPDYSDCDAIPLQTHVRPDRTVRLSSEAEREGVRRSMLVYFENRFLIPYQRPLVTAKKAIVAGFRINPLTLEHPTRAVAAVRIRQIAIAMARRLTTASVNNIGSAFGGRDHSTITHAVQKFGWLIDEVEAELFAGQSCSIKERA